MTKRRAYLKSINISDKTLKSIEFIDYAMDKGVYNAVKKFERDLIPQNINKTRQSGIYNF
jgi:hypothetical protein